MKFTYLQQPPKRYTFEQPKLKKWIQKRCKGRVLNLFAGKTRLELNEIRVDIDPTMNPNYCIDAFEFIKTYEGPKFDTVILDPPYNQRKGREKYHNHYIGKYTKLKRKLPRILSDYAIVIQLGYKSTGMGRGFIKKEICLVNHGGDHNDTIVLLEERNGSMDKFIYTNGDDD